MKTHLITAILMNAVAAIYTIVIHKTVIQDMHVQPFTAFWWWLAIPALGLVGYALCLVLYALKQESKLVVSHWTAEEQQVYTDTGDWQAKAHWCRDKQKYWCRDKFSK